MGVRVAIREGHAQRDAKPGYGDGQDHHKADQLPAVYKPLYGTHS